MSIATAPPATAIPTKIRPSSPHGEVPAASSSLRPSQAPSAMGTAMVSPTWPRIAALERAPPGVRGEAKTAAVYRTQLAFAAALLHRLAAVARPKDLRPAGEVVPKLGAKPGLPVLRIGEVALYDRPLEHLAGHLDRAELELPLRFFAARYGLVLCFALEPVEAALLGGELVRVSHPDGAIWLAVWKEAFAKAGAPRWDEAQAAVLARGWVDNKILSLGEEVYATRFVRRRRHADGAGTAGGSAAS